MILPLRKLHRRTFAALSIALPIAFAVGVAGRRQVPMEAALPAEFAGPERGSVTRSTSGIQAVLGKSDQLSATNMQRLTEPGSGN
jgi:hypothetical protein